MEIIKEANTNTATALHSNLKKAGIIVPLIFLMVYASIPFLPSEFEAEIPVLELIGRFHPLVLHFPIVLIIIFTLFALLGSILPPFRHSLIFQVLLGMACLTTFIAIVAGYLLYATEEYSGQLVKNHLVGGLLTGTGISITTAAYYYWEMVSEKAGLFFWTALLFTNGALGYTSHLGGSLTHGQDYLTQPLASMFPGSTSVEIRPVEEMLLYEDVVTTIIDSKCASCHNENKTKGDLLLISHDHILKAGESGNPAVVPGDLEKSELMARILLPESDEDRMPPEGKPGLTKDEIDLLAYWIESGAPQELRLSDIEDIEFKNSIDKLLPAIRKTQRRLALEKEAFEEMKVELKEIGTKINVQIVPDEEADGYYFGMKMKFPPSPISSKELLEIAPYSSYFSRISLASTNISDDELYHLGQMENLKRLVLQKTAIDGSGLPYLQQLPNLEELNLSFTPLKDGHALHLLNFPHLKKVYLFGTPVKKDIITAIQQHKPHLQVILEEGPYY
ncbi:c-type cytochrome domain-containing protein [Negadavirga shengliensis]|uniref:C-type cytochrome domain-containing protein n=1 Tax=Negadavirga shengliensis TaxID=1389218 RepID=A0ABV9SYU2_9BACT